MMFNTLKKYASTISVVLLATLLATLLFCPASSQTLSTVIILFGIGTVIAFTLNSNWEKHKEGEITRAEFIRNTFLDLLGLALTMGAAIWLGRLAGGYAGQRVGIITSQGWAMAAGIAAGMITGFGAAFLVGKLWNIVSNRLQASPA